MTADETVPVRVKLLKKIHDYLDDEPMRIALEQVIPKPRLVTVDLDELKAIYNNDSPRVRHDMVGDLIQRLEEES